MNVQQRILKITENLKTIPKKGYNRFQNYEYVRAVDLIAEVRKQLIGVGICIKVSEQEIDRIKDEKNWHTRLKCNAVIFNAEDPKDFIELNYYTVSADTLDKDIFKAKTNGLKYLYTQLFNIESDALVDTEENDSSVELPTYENYVITFGKLKGQKLCDVEKKDLDGYIKFIKMASKENNKPITGEAKVLIDLVEGKK